MGLVRYRTQPAKAHDSFSFRRSHFIHAQPRVMQAHLKLVKFNQEFSNVKRNQSRAATGAAEKSFDRTAVGREEAVRRSFAGQRAAEACAGPGSTEPAWTPQPRTRAGRERGSGS